VHGGGGTQDQDSAVRLCVRHLVVVVFVNVAELSALGRHLGEQTAP